jgi:hypothetical protein
MAGRTRVSVKTKKLRGKAIVRGGAGTATRTVGLLGGILTYAVEAGIIESNPAHAVRKPKDNVGRGGAPLSCIILRRNARLWNGRSWCKAAVDISFFGSGA